MCRFDTQQAVATLEWPSGGFAWDDKLRSRLPIIRGIRAPKLETDAASPGKPPPSLADEPSPSLPEEYATAWTQHFWQGLVRNGTMPAGTLPWTNAEVEKRIKDAAPSKPDLDYWRILLFQCAARFRFSSQSRLGWAVERLVASQRLAFAVEAMLSTGETIASHFIAQPFDIWRDRPHCYAHLRQALAAAPEDQWREAFQVAEGFRGHSGQLDCVICYLFPEQRAWADEAAMLELPIEKMWWLDETALSVEAACHHYRRHPVGIERATPRILLQIHLHREAALPFLELALTTADRDAVPKFLKWMRKMRYPALIPTLAAHIEDDDIRAELDALAERWPAAVLKCAIERACATRSRSLESWAERLALRLPQAVEPALAACSAAERERFQRLLDSFEDAQEAAPEDLPDLLRDPPWQGRAAAALPCLDLAPLQPVEEMVWPDGLKEAWAKCQVSSGYYESGWQWFQQKNPASTLEGFYLDKLDIKDTAHAKVLAGGRLDAGDFVEKDQYCNNTDILLLLPEVAALAVWDSHPASLWSAWGSSGALRTFFTRHGVACLPGLLAYAKARPVEGLGLALPFRSPRLAALAAHALKSVKIAKQAAAQWLLAHAETAAIALIPQAFGTDPVPRVEAQTTLRWLAQNGHEALLHQAAARYGEAAAQAVGRLLATDPALIVPAKMPKLPRFFVAAAFRRPVLVTGGALPLSAVEHLGSMLAISSLQEPYAGLERVKAACTGASLAAFAWDLFEAWLGAGAPGKESWAFKALGLLGNDETARRLAPKIREWPGQGAKARAVSGLDLLEMIGSDVALMHLDSIANKPRFKGLQEKARSKIAKIAEARGLSTEELADRLVPDLELDADGTALLDFGPRRFYVGFDETLKPFVKNEAGLRLKDLPKPNKADDAGLAAAATERYKALKKDAKSVASLQISRLERIMCQRRRWSAADFRRFFVEHPLSRHLARRLVWGAYRDGALADAFRVAEDLSFADRADDTYALPEGVEVGVAHVLEMPEDLARDFGQVFADYEILQPFRQLGRETYALTDAELQANQIRRFNGKQVAVGSILGLLQKGWERGDAEDGWIGYFGKLLPNGLEAGLMFDPGIPASYLNTAPEREQTIGAILMFNRLGAWHKQPASFAELDAVAASEILRDVDLLTPLAN